MPICPVLLESSPDKHERVESMKRDVEGKGILIKLVNSIPDDSKAPEDELVRQAYDHLVRRAYDPVAERGRPKKNR